MITGEQNINFICSLRNYSRKNLISEGSSAPAVLLATVVIISFVIYHLHNISDVNSLSSYVWVCYELSPCSKKTTLLGGPPLSCPVQSMSSTEERLASLGLCLRYYDK